MMIAGLMCMSCSIISFIFFNHIKTNKSKKLDKKTLFFSFLISCILAYLWHSDTENFVISFAKYITIGIIAAYLSLVINKKTPGNTLSLIYRIGICTLLYYYCYKQFLIGNLGYDSIPEQVSFINKLQAALFTIMMMWIFCDFLTKKNIPYLKELWAIFVLSTPFIAFYVQEQICNPKLIDMAFKFVILNTAIFSIIFWSLFIFFNHKIVAFYFIYSIAFIIGIIQHYVVLFRGTPIIPADILVVGTAAKVSTKYDFIITNGIVKSVILCLLLFIMLTIFKEKGFLYTKANFPFQKTRKITAILVFMLLPAWIMNVSFVKTYGIRLASFFISDFYHSYGFEYSFFSYLQNMKMEKPDGYSLEMVKQLFNESNTLYNHQNDIETKKKPTIIAIMNESFSDLSVLGDLGLKEDILKNFNALDNTIEKGYMYVSVIGGGTATTEFEFLTGNTRAFIPETQPYSVFDFQKVSTMVSTLEQQDYDLIAIHPERPGNYRRDKVYQAMGFDEFLSISNFEKPHYIRGMVSDLSDYQMIIDLFEKNRDSGAQLPQFIFNVTMQNHGGYNSEAMEPELLIDRNFKLGKYDDFWTYLSLMKQSDEALGYLMNYFSSIEDPVIICFFGDHQPSLDRSVLSELLKEKYPFAPEYVSNQEYYKVPYFIWCNYETGLTTVEPNVDLQSANRTSPGFLGRKVLNYAGIELTDYDKFVLNLEKEIPIINSFGYQDITGNWYQLDDPNLPEIERNKLIINKDYETLLKKYKILEYYSLFGNKG